MKRLIVTAALSGLTALACVGDAAASGFAIHEQSSSALGNAFAGSSAAATDISYSFFNPATLALHNKRQALLSVSYIAPFSEAKDANASTLPPISAPIGGRDHTGDIGDNAVVPAFYAMAPVGPRVRIGLNVNAPFGLSTSNPKDWVGRYHAIDSQLTTIDISPMVAAKVNRWLSVGGGLQIEYAHARLTSAIDFGTIGAASGIPFAVPTTQDGRAKIKADDWGVGGTLGIIVEPQPGTRLGVAWRSQIDHTLEGDADFTLDSAGVGQALQGATGAFQNTDVKADITMPETVSVGAYHELTNELAVLGQFEWTHWSRFDELRIKFDNPSQPDNVTDENWDNTVFVAAGFTYRPTNNLRDFTFRIGGAYDQSPIPNAAHRTPRLPGADRYWLAFGGSYEPNEQFKVDLGYTHIFMKDGKVQQTTSGTGNTFRGNLDATYENHVNIVTLQARMLF